MFLPGAPEHLLALVRLYGAFEKTVRDLSGLDAEHAADLTKKLTDQDANIVRASPDAIAAAIEQLRADDPTFFERAPTGQHLYRLMRAVEPHIPDRAYVASAVDRMNVSTKRRAMYATVKRLEREGKLVPEPQPGDGNIAMDLVRTKQAPHAAPDRDALRPPHMRGRMR